MEDFPIVHTNFWDVLFAVPTVVILTQVLKLIFRLKPVLVPTLANIIGLTISVFFAHKGNIWTGIFMGFFYGNAAVGFYSSLKTTILAYRKSKKENMS